MSDTASPVWFITGCSTGFGRELARLVLDRGWRAVVTARDRARVEDLAQGRDGRALALALDVIDDDDIEAGVAAALKAFGRIDVLVNNAGYGYLASIEEGVAEEIRAQFEANVFGLFAMTRAVLPVMRRQKSGHVINIASVAGFCGFPGSGYYAASKHAVEGFSDSLAKEAAPLGIKVTVVEPGPFRTDWAGRSMTQTASTIPDYAETVASRMATTSKNSGTQAGDPVRAGEAMIALVAEANPPLHLVLGEWGHDAVVKKLKETLAEVESRRQTALDTDYPAGER
ncbi:oxidoreductase [Lichenibacterium ramalinae]|uniref:SDR family NAD(P)-dependent oxidoreductase n=1 Tax=Lichenibacterium ramalinae TaxID=2316527 RepID=A0A4Q2RA08_9HYPH|nr:oxidoreductase [Lichenibacterium ramalinae]RYB03853.1 SDR family NAD(P)-dependent oxidoreductase [Lichenibacterium ramalinae]